MQEIINVYGIEVVHSDPLNGGGWEVMQEMVNLLKEWYPGHQFERAFEWCAGPGYMGFALLGSGLAKTLVLSDVYEHAFQAQKQTVINNELNNVILYNSDNLNKIPIDEQWDLVVGNPPHFPNSIQRYDFLDPRLYVDDNWELHKEFFLDIKQHLAPNGKILLWESNWGSSIETLTPWIKSAGLKVNRYGNAVTTYDADYWYWVEIVHD